MEEIVKQSLTKTNRVINGVVGYNHKLNPRDVEYSVFWGLREEETLSVSDDRINLFFKNDYKKALETARNDINFDKLQEDKKVEILTNLIRNV